MRNGIEKNWIKMCDRAERVLDMKWIVPILSSVLIYSTSQLVEQPETEFFILFKSYLKEKQGK